MVDSGLVNVPGDTVDGNDVDLPPMMFADGEEPVGVRVLTYQSSRSINTILNALNEEEIRYLKNSSFGKLVDLAEKPAFSGRFARYLLSRQLKVEKKHEVWFRFAGKPIRFSLREFAIVTGLPCGEVPKKKKMKKKNIQDKPYWPELFGSMEEMRVSRAVKMLRRKTVTDRDIRIKLACLAIVSSVLLSTNLKMKMLKEHAELLRDIEEFLTYPWGRLAFDLLMTSIKNRDEISLSQNTIALKGFALALQLVIVEAVPALTEVVQDACSSSESESEDDETENPVSKAMKKTLNPAHARDVDREAEAEVRSIIPQDPQRPVNESVLVWRDEVVDIRVEKLVNLIMQNFGFQKNMFKGGASKSDVEKMREESRNLGKKKQRRENEKPSVGGDDGKLASTVLALLNPEIKRIDGNVSAGIASMKELVSSSVQYKDDVLATVSRMIMEMKNDILRTIAGGTADVVPHGHNVSLSTSELSKTGYRKQRSGLCDGGNGGNGDLASQSHHISHNIGVASKPCSSKQPDGGVEDMNALTIENVLENLSHYSTPPGSPNEVEVAVAGYVEENSSIGRSGRIFENQQLLNQKALEDIEDMEANKRHETKTPIPTVSLPVITNKQVTSVTRRSASLGPVDYTRPEMSPLSGHSETRLLPRSDMEQPSFSLGLTQEKVAPLTLQEEDMAENETELVDSRNDDPHISRKSKRMRIVPTYLLTGYHCESAILNRARQGQLWGPTYYEMSVVREKYVRLWSILKKPCLINVAGLSVTQKDIVDIAERNRLLPGKVVDILMRLVRSIFDIQVRGKVDVSAAFLDSRFVSLLCRNHPKFKLQRNKSAFLFSKSLVDAVVNSCGSFNAGTRYYLPFCIGKQHWIGLCLDFIASKLYVLDFNVGLTAESAICKELLPICEMFPFLLKQSGVSVAAVDTPLVVERIQGLSQNQNPADSAITTALLIQTHSLFGTDPCLAITPSVIPDEAHRAAVMVYEFHAKL